MKIACAKPNDAFETSGTLFRELMSNGKSQVCFTHAAIAMKSNNTVVLIGKYCGKPFGL